MHKVKKVLCALISFAIILSSFLCANINACAETYSGECGDNLTWTLKTVSGKITISGTGEMYDYWYDGDNRAPWEKYNNYTSPITSLVINEGVTSIGARAFYGSHFIETILLPNSLETIGTQAFQGCNRLQNLVIPNSVTELGDGAFTACGSLTDIHLGAGITKLPLDTFSSNIKLTEFIVPDTITEIGQGVFRQCSNLETVKLGKNVKTMKSEVFSNCSALKELFIPTSLESMGPYSFDGCTSLKDIYYCGSESDWNDLDIHPDITSFISKNNVEVHFNYSVGEEVTEPSAEPSTDPSTNEGTKPSTTTTSAANTSNATIAECTHSSTKIEIVNKATLKSNGTKRTVCNKCGKVISTNTIKFAKSFTISKSSYTYSGKPLAKPTVTVKDSAGNKISSSNYTVSYISRSSNKPVSTIKGIGQYKIKVTLKGEYSGTKYLYFSVNPKKPTLKNLSSKSNSITATWAKDNSISGYQILIATDSNFTKNKKTVTISKNSTTSYKFNKLNKGKKYYIKIRAYKTIKVDGKSAKIYGPYCACKSVKYK